MGECFQAEPLPPARGTAVSAAASERGDERVFNPLMLPAESMVAYLKSVSEVWLGGGGIVGKSPKHGRYAGGKAGKPKGGVKGVAGWLDGYSLELALEILHKHDYSPIAAMAEVGQCAPPQQLVSLWSEHERCAFEHGICTYGKDFDAIHRLLPSKSVRELIGFFYERKCRLDLCSCHSSRCG